MQSERLYKSVFEMTAKGYEGGIVSVFEYLNAKNGYFDALAKTVSYKKEYTEEIAKLEKVFTEVIR
jgi:outer membrane protein TolC